MGGFQGLGVVGTHRSLLELPLVDGKDGAQETGNGVCSLVHVLVGLRQKIPPAERLKEEQMRKE